MRSMDKQQKPRVQYRDREIDEDDDKIKKLRKV